MYNWITLFYTWNYHNVIDQLYPNKYLRTCNLHFSDKIRDTVLSSSSTNAENGYSGVMAHEQKGADKRKTHGNQAGCIHQPPTRIMKNSKSNIKDAGQGVETHEGARQE